MYDAPLLRVQFVIDDPGDGIPVATSKSSSDPGIADSLAGKLKLDCVKRGACCVVVRFDATTSPVELYVSIHDGSLVTGTLNRGGGDRA